MSAVMDAPATPADDADSGAHPIFANAPRSVEFNKLRKRLKTEFGTVRPPRACNQLAPMDNSPECAELLRVLHPLYLC